MKMITMLELRQNSQAIIRRLLDGEEMALTYRGKHVGTLVPKAAVEYGQPGQESVYAKLLRLSEEAGKFDEHLTNEDIDKIVYGS